ncbi:hypothetical protein M011DRAFT_515738 [Sporormia fimetaria CBS 119925]|uniref:Protein kinase domain-containing protein n=1 Tax=Sporormia fimetaria CBS 119925 TaxID=1340428 RepID=A0A6A6VGV1_9PLEO|nr:hypothetical protein M011DRAFT_515738 [Sporormia fimetaria CBS 119925]
MDTRKETRERLERDGAGDTSLASGRMGGEEKGQEGTSYFSRPRLESKSKEVENTESNNEHSTPSQNMQDDKTTADPEMEILEFPYHKKDYDLEESKRTLLGTGLWSDVYLATPKTPLPDIQTQVQQPLLTLNPRSRNLIRKPAAHPRPLSPQPNHAQSTAAPTVLTPPTSPTHSRSSSLTTAPDIPTHYAIKLAASKSAVQVLRHEAKILTLLTPPSSPSTVMTSHIVPFHGLDTRNNALVLTAMDTSLDAYITTTLSVSPTSSRSASLRSESQRAELLAASFETIARGVCDALCWCEERGVVHGDVKPGNVLLGFSEVQGHQASKSERIVQKVVLADFSSAAIVRERQTTTTTTRERQNGSGGQGGGGGTWIFMHPCLLRRSSGSTIAPVKADFTTDTWSVALTLLYLVVGTSPYEYAGENRFRQMEAVKMGRPMEVMRWGENGGRSVERLRGLEERVGWRVGPWLGVVLGESAEVRGIEMGKEGGCEGGIGWRRVQTRKVPERLSIEPPPPRPRSKPTTVLSSRFRALQKHISADISMSIHGALSQVALSESRSDQTISLRIPENRKVLQR